MNAFESPGNTYSIDQFVIDEYAPKLFNMIRQMYDDLWIIANNLGLDPKTVTVPTIERVTELYGVLPGKNVVYDPCLLDNSSFRMDAIFYASCCKLVGREMDYNSFRSMKPIIDNLVSMSFHGEVKSTISVDSIVIQKLNVNPNVLPKDYLVKISHTNEFSDALEKILNIKSELEVYPFSFPTFDSLIEYMEPIVAKLQNDLHSDGYYGTHSLERFTLLMVGLFIGGPPLDVIYKVGNYNFPINMSDDQIKMMYNEIWEVRKRIDEDPGDEDPPMDSEGF